MTAPTALSELTTKATGWTNPKGLSSIADLAEEREL